MAELNRRMIVGRLSTAHQADMAAAIVARLEADADGPGLEYMVGFVSDRCARGELSAVQQRHFAVQLLRRARDPNALLRGAARRPLLLDWSRSVLSPEERREMVGFALDDAQTRYQLRVRSVVTAGEEMPFDIVWTPSLDLLPLLHWSVEELQLDGQPAPRTLEDLQVAIVRLQGLRVGFAALGASIQAPSPGQHTLAIHVQLSLEDQERTLPLSAAFTTLAPATRPASP